MRMNILPLLVFGLLIALPAPWYAIRYSRTGMTSLPHCQPHSLDNRHLRQRRGHGLNWPMSLIMREAWRSLAFRQTVAK